ncbi:MAG: oligosaccharide flippase family protein, partial [Planctomycetota bacterium]
MGAGAQAKPASPNTPTLDYTSAEPPASALGEKQLRKSAVRGGAWAALAQGCNFLAGFVSTIFLARLLTPGDYGLIAMAAAFTGLATLLRDFGIVHAIVQTPTLSHAQAGALFWLNAALALVIGSIIGALAPLMVWFYDEPRLMAVTLALAAVFVVGGLPGPLRGLLRRELRFRDLALINIISTLSGISCAIAAAFAGLGYWALVVLPAATAVSYTIAVWIATRFRPTSPLSVFRWRELGLGALFKFGGNLTAFGLLNYAVRNLDNVLIGRFHGGAALGLYSKSYALLVK